MDTSLTMVEEMLKIENFAQMCAFPKVHTKDEQCDEKYGLYIANVI